MKYISKQFLIDHTNQIFAIWGLKILEIHMKPQFQEIRKDKKNHYNMESTLFKEKTIKEPTFIIHIPQIPTKHMDSTTQEMTVQQSKKKKTIFKLKNYHNLPNHDPSKKNKK